MFSVEKAIWNSRKPGGDAETRDAAYHVLLLLLSTPYRCYQLNPVPNAVSRTSKYSSQIVLFPSLDAANSQVPPSTIRSKPEVTSRRQILVLPKRRPRVIPYAHKTTCIKNHIMLLCYIQQSHTTLPTLRPQNYIMFLCYSSSTPLSPPPPHPPFVFA